MNLFFLRKRNKPSNPLISIIIPTLNAVLLLEKTLNSILNQSFRNIEIVVVDGLSTDGTIEIINAAVVRDSRVRSSFQHDRGVYDAMNIGLPLCKGEWVYFIGAGDVLTHENIFSELFDEGYFKQRKVFYGNVIIDGDTPWAKDKEVYAGEFNLEKLLHGNICHQAIFYPRKMMENAGIFNLRYAVAADWDYNIRCWAIKPFVHVDKIIARFSAGGLSTLFRDDLLVSELPENIIRCFHLDPGDSKFIEPGSPFRNVILAYHEKLNQQSRIT